MNHHFEQLSDTRKAILMAIKQNGSETIARLVSKLHISSEGVRQHLVQLEKDGLIKRFSKKTGSGGGRPAIKVCLTPQGETLFPKKYEALTIEVIDTVSKQLGEDAMKKVLTTMTEARVKDWEWRLTGLSFSERIAALKDFYETNDSYMDVEHSDETIRLTERNCPFHDVAIQRPVLCNVTLSTLTRLLGYRVVREKSFQNGDGCCVFRVSVDQPVDVDSLPFMLEEE